MEIHMVAKGNKDQHRMTYSGGVKAVETMKWGADKARDRAAGKNLSAPQKLGDANNLQGPGYANEVPLNSWLRGGGKGGEGYKYFDTGKKR
jgi:hypothetical protein